MTCDPLAYTGSGQLSLLLIVAICCLIAGALLLLMTRRRSRAATVVLMLLVSGAAMLITAGTPTPAVADECPQAGTSAPDNSAAYAYPIASIPADNSLTVTQTSVMDGLAPGIDPMPIWGIVTNNGTDSTVIDWVRVEIIGVVAEANAVPLDCDASDYLLLDPPGSDHDDKDNSETPGEAWMPVRTVLEPGASTSFSGATIKFNNKSTNQDACKGATILLRYTANPG